MIGRRRYFSRGRIERELDAELRDHLARRVADLVRLGMSESEAQRRARLEFGGLEGTKAACRDARRTKVLEDVGRDAHAAIRSLRATPGFTLVALLVLTLGIGASTAIYSVVDAVVLRGLPFDRSSRLVAVAETNTKTAEVGQVAPQTFLDWRARQDVFDAIAAVGYGGIQLAREGAAEPEALRGNRVTADFFRVLRAAPLLGRTFTPEDERDEHAHVAVISYGLWQRRFGGAPDIVGRWLPSGLAGGDFQVIGVMPQAFVYPVGSIEADDVWVPYIFAAEDYVRGHDYGYNLDVTARLRDGVTISRAQARMDQLAAAIAAANPSSPPPWFKDRGVRVELLHDYLAGSVRTWMLMLLGAVGFVLLIACVNVANLLLVRATTRTRELAVRSALGATRWDLARALLVESIILSAAGATLGVLAAWWGVDVLRRAMPADVPRIGLIAVNLRVLTFTAVTAVVTGVAFGLAPVLQLSRPSASRTLGEHGRRYTAGSRSLWLRAALVVSEVALAVVLLVGAGLFLATFARAANVDLGLDYRNVLMIHVRPMRSVPRPDEVASLRARTAKEFADLIERVRAIPGVSASAIVSGGVPLTGSLTTTDFAVAGRSLSERERDIDIDEISPDYFTVLRVPLLAGRVFTTNDDAGAERVVVLNEIAARTYFGGASAALDRIVRLGKVDRRVVGVVGNIRHDGPESDWRRETFVPFSQLPGFGATLVVRSMIPSSAVTDGVKNAIWSVFPDVTIPETPTLESDLHGLLAEHRFNMLLLGLFGVLAIVIAGLGIYGVLAYAVTERTQEIGIRMALGAAPGTIVGAVLGRASLYLGAGLAAGLAGAWLLAGFVTGFLFRVQPHDPAIYALVCAVLVATGLSAAFIPARRAASVDPVVALRAD